MLFLGHAWTAGQAGHAQKMVKERGMLVSELGQYLSCWPGCHQSWWWHSVISVFVFFLEPRSAVL